MSNFNINANKTYKDIQNIKNLKLSQKQDLAIKLVGIEHAIKDFIYTICKINKAENTFAIRISFQEIPNVENDIMYRIEMYSMKKHINFIIDFYYKEFINTMCNKEQFELMMNKYIGSVILKEKEMDVYKVSDAQTVKIL